MIIGIDEAGRGCWAGPLVAAAVVLPGPIDGLTDSKKLNGVARAGLDVIIRGQALGYGIGWVHPAVIDKVGLTAATSLAMAEALSHIQADGAEIIIDGNYNYLPDQKNVKTIIKADALVPAVSAASILAKVARDNYMHAAAKDYPDYSFDRHVGYGTALHKQLLEKFGICQLHRQSYKPIQKIMASLDVDH